MVKQDHFSTFAENAVASGRYQPEEMAEIFGRLITNAFFDEDVDQDIVERWGTRAGHFARLALMQQENHAVARDAWLEGRTA